MYRQKSGKLAKTRVTKSCKIIPVHSTYSMSFNERLVVTRPGLTTNAGLHLIERGLHIVSGLAVGRMLTLISSFVHIVRQKLVMLLPKLIILSDVV